MHSRAGIQPSFLATDSVTARVLPYVACKLQPGPLIHGNDMKRQFYKHRFENWLHYFRTKTWPQGGSLTQGDGKPAPTKSHQDSNHLDPIELSSLVWTQERIYAIVISALYSFLRTAYNNQSKLRGTWLSHGRVPWRALPHTAGLPMNCAMKSALN